MACEYEMRGCVGEQYGQGLAARQGIGAAKETVRIAGEALRTLAVASVILGALLW
jgi:hypothetical protein